MIRAAQFQEYFQRYKRILLITLLLIFYTVGTVGLLSEKRDAFLALSFLNLAISFVVLILSRMRHSWRFYAFCVFGFFLGMSAEWLGVHTGILFGDYHYGPNLGVHWWEVPVIIGVNWVMLTIITAAVVKRLKYHWLLKALLATLLMLALDLLIEPVAIESDYWTWDGAIPISNFIGWFLVALLLQMLYFGSRLNEPNKVAVVLFFIQVVFFTVQNIF
ncbi:MAG: carotenoid biosynthesis protein [Bacteroidota bacterium]